MFTFRSKAATMVACLTYRRSLKHIQGVAILPEAKVLLPMSPTF